LFKQSVISAQYVLTLLTQHIGKHESLYHLFVL